MAIGIDGYNAVFRNFAQFAQRCSDGGAGKAVITAEEGQPLNGRRVVSISNTYMDSVYVMRRGAEQKTTNDINNQGSMEFTLSMDDSGAIKMTCFCRKDVAMIMSFGENGAVKNTRVGAGSKMEAQVELLLRPAEMDRLAELDFSKFDENEAKQLFVGTSNNKLETIYNGFPRDFRLNYDNIACSSHFKATLN